MRLLSSFSFLFFQFGQNLGAQGVVSQNSAIGNLHDDLAARGHAHIDEAEWLGDAPAIEVQGQVGVLSLHMLGNFVFDPLESNALLVNGLEEDLILAFPLEEQLDIVTCNRILELLFRGLAIRIGRGRQINHVCSPSCLI